MQINLDKSDATERATGGSRVKNLAENIAAISERRERHTEMLAELDQTGDLSAYDLYLRAYEMYFSSPRQMPEALGLLERAIERDPHYGPALAWAAVCCLRLEADGWSTDRAVDRRKSVDFARRALQVADDDPGTLANAALALAYFGEDIGAMMVLVDRALALNPSFARGWYIGGILRLLPASLSEQSSVSRLRCVSVRAVRFSM